MTISVCVFSNLSCNPTAATNKSEQKFYIYKTQAIDFGFEKAGFNHQMVSGVFPAENGKFILLYKKQTAGEEKESYFKVLSEIGVDSGRDYRITDVFNFREELESYIIKSYKETFLTVGSRKENIFFSKFATDSVDKFAPVQINDEQNSVIGDVKFLHIDAQNIFCIWIDKRHGFSSVYFSHSVNGGESWSANQPIEYDFREADQTRPQFVLGKNNRLHVFWEDWRDPRTLVDIRYSYSDDGGKNWTPSVRINQDEKRVWQIQPSAAVSGNDVFVAFSDFSEPGEDDDNDWNIYLAHSANNGLNWKQTKRLNDEKLGRDTNPVLVFGEDKNLYCLWRTTRHTLFGQIAFSYSVDTGKNWSPSQVLTDEKNLIVDQPVNVFPVLPDKFMAAWTILDAEKLSGKFVFSFLEKTSKEVNAEKNQIKTERFENSPLKFTAGRELFKDDFSNNFLENWHIEKGFWETFDGSFMGVKPNAAGDMFIARLKFSEPEEYILKGRFKLDPIAHMSANIFFRYKGMRNYLIVNNFRHGTWLALKDNDLFYYSNIIGGKPLEQKRFSFRQNRWYEFTLVVTPEQADYYVDGRLMFSYRENLILPPGSIGIGGYANAPTYFDDISILELKR